MNLSDWYKSGGHLPKMKEGGAAEPAPENPLLNIGTLLTMSGMPESKASRRLSNRQRPMKSVERKMNEGGVANVAPYGIRHSGEGVKGMGYFGPLQGAEGVSTEISAEDESGEFPLLVPTLTAEEVKLLLSGGQPTEAIYRKAAEHARTRRESGKSPFSAPTELRYPLPTDDLRMAGGGVVYMAGGGIPPMGNPMGDIAYSPDAAVDNRGNYQKILDLFTQKAKAQGKEELASMKDPRAITDLINKGLIAENLGGVVDIFSLPLEMADALINLALKTDKRYVSSEVPFGGSESMKRGMEKIGAATTTERPMMELGTSIVGPAAVAKTIQQAPKVVAGAKKAGEAMNLSEWYRSGAHLPR